MPLNIERMPLRSTEQKKEPASPEKEADIEKHPAEIIFAFEKHGDITAEQEAKATEAFAKASARLAGEWNLTSPLTIKTALMSDTAFREGAGENDHASWKSAFFYATISQKIKSTAT